MKIAFLTIFLCFSTPLSSQIRLTGSIIDKSTQQSLPFVNIGIKNKNVGAISSESGAFSILIPKKNINDTLTFSLVGYQLKTIPVQQLMTQEKTIITLQARAIELKQVEITAKKPVETKHGLKKTKPVIRFIDASMDHGDIFEIAQMVRLSDKPAKITSVNLLINEARADSGTFRINFYKFDGSKPTERLIDASILETRAVREGWLKFDVKKYDIFLKGDVVMAIEFLPAKKVVEPIRYEVKLGGTSKSFVRTSSLGIWNTPPHHYRMFLTLLEAEPSPGSQKEEEEMETPPQARLFSKEVKDTFSLFIHLPRGYKGSKDKRYPVVFLLDGNVYHDILNASVEKINSKSKVAEPILVGIGYKNAADNVTLRDRDYTFPAALPEDSFLLSGGAEKFLRFIEKELNGYLVKNYRIDTTQRTLMGHSLAGYFTLFALQKHLHNQTLFFKNYVAASPSLEYHHSYLLSEFQKMQPPASGNLANTQLFITIGSREAEDMVTFNRFTDLISAGNFKEITTTTVVFPDADHMGAAIPAFEKAFERIPLKN